MLPSPLAASQTAPEPSAIPDAADRRRRGSTVTGARGTAREGPDDARPSDPSVVAAGSCYAWPLPADATCASEARTAFRTAATSLGLAGDLVHDGVTMASELAANTLHARDNIQFDATARGAVAGGPELWIYLRWAGGGWELACKVFDSMRGWRGGRAPQPTDTVPDALSGRGLHVVDGLSGGRWGHHLTRSRFGCWKVPGKVVWFGLPVPDESVPARLRGAGVAPASAARALERMLARRGFGEGLLRVEDHGAAMSVLSVRYGITLWCQGAEVRWLAWEGYRRHPLADVEEVAEQVVAVCEEIDDGRPVAEPGPLF
jgi:hypothetical protein